MSGTETYRRKFNFLVNGAGQLGTVWKRMNSTGPSPEKNDGREAHEKMLNNFLKKVKHLH